MASHQIAANNTMATSAAQGDNLTYQKLSQQNMKGGLKMSPSEPSLTKEDLEDCMKDLRAAVGLTVARMSAICDVYRFEVEERDNVAPNKKEAELKYLLFNICKEAKHVLVTFSRPEFTDEGSI